MPFVGCCALVYFWTLRFSRIGDFYTLRLGFFGNLDLRIIGVDGSTRQRDFDFEQVRGEFENDAFVKMVCKHIEDKTALGNELIGRLETLMTSMPQH